MSEKPTITPIENGPYRVSNCPTLMTLDGSTTFDTSPTIALCRCGGSKNKPFCDGTHNKNGFSSEKKADRVPDERQDYVGQSVTIHDNRGICAHAGRCTDGLPSVFRLKQEPWIDPDGASADEIIATVRQCPSGALSHSVDGVEHRNPESREPTIRVAPNGPYAIVGGVELEGAEFGEGASREHFDLCRCGQSKNKPFCDGSHWYHEFDEQARK